MTETRYKAIGIGGTFDHFHKGHEKFILFAAYLASHLHIGVTEPALTLQKPFAAACEEYGTRARQVSEFCEKRGIPHTIIPLPDIYGPTLEDTSIEALCVTEDTLPGGHLINKARAERGLPILPIHVCGYELNEAGNPLHSADIRAGFVNRQGRLYERILEQEITLTEEQRKFFAAPQGAILSLVKDASSATLREPAYVVGDTTLEYFIEHKLPYHLGVYDKKRNRKPAQSSILDTLQPDMVIQNTPGTLAPESARAFHAALHRNTKHIFVEGEEDTATIILALLLPLGTTLYYGQPNLGMVALRVTESVKESFSRALSSLGARKEALQKTSHSQ
ncbi:MAG: DUF359 domain-containing protein [Candidatus Yanofskybacteria bacterium]|nr:DUF359 domain-containing protein [Candidatus Yanofskybacteria bacterium]